jgi:hypothetical protein
VLDVAAVQPGAPLATVDLHYVQDFDIYLTTAREYEGLVRQIFPLLRLDADPEAIQGRTPRGGAPPPEG